MAVFGDSDDFDVVWGSWLRELDRGYHRYSSAISSRALYLDVRTWLSNCLSLKRDESGGFVRDDCTTSMVQVGLDSDHEFPCHCCAQLSSMPTRSV
jgi:hypothetical protein